VVLEKDVDDQLGRSREKSRSIVRNQGGEEYPTNSRERRISGFVTLA
jgi:hypothetical protein